MWLNYRAEGIPIKCSIFSTEHQADSLIAFCHCLSLGLCLGHWSGKLQSLGQGGWETDWINWFGDDIMHLEIGLETKDT